MKDATDFASLVPPISGGRTYPFAVSNERSAKALRSLADLIEAGHVALQSVETKQTTGTSDFSTKTLTVIYAESIADGR